MAHETTEIAPRGTWNDDNASEIDDAPRRSVSGPYRDPLAAVKARRAALERELRALDRLLREREPGRDRGAVQRVLDEPALARAWVRAAEWGRRVAVVAIPLAMLVMMAEMLPSYVQRDHVVVVHDGPGLVRVEGARDDARFVVARSMLDRLLAHGLSPGRLEPVVERDRIVGLRVTAPFGGDVAAIGLRNGDVVLGVDDHALWQPDGAARAYDTLRTASRFVLVVRRAHGIERLAFDVVG